MAREWLGRGCKVVIVTQSAPLVRRLPAGVDVRVIPRGGWYDHIPIAQVRRFIALRRIVRSVRPDLVHTYFFWSIMYGRMLKLFGEIGTLVENREDLGFSWGRGAYAALRFTRAIPDRVICVANAVRRVALERERLDPLRTTVVHNGIAATAAARVTARADARRAFGFDDRHVVIGMVANLPRVVKGGSRLLDAVGYIVASTPNARFLLVGQGTEPSTLEPELRARGIENYVVGAGYRTDVDVCYAAMDLSVLTSSTEGLSITLLESMRHGLPTVVTRVGGNAEAVHDGVTGYLVALDDRRAFVERVIELVRNERTRRTMGEAGRRRVEERFSLDGAARQYLEIYGELLEPAGARPSGHPEYLQALEINA
jgi:glycosyltransferase involved in cell wall biosynthesis